MAAQMLRCRESFTYDDKRGVPVNVPAGALRPAGHADVKGRESSFELVEDTAARESTRTSYTPEMATANPGQARSLSRP